VELGTPLGKAIDAVGSGVAPDRRVKAVFSGVSNPVLTGDELQTPLTYEAFASVGSGMGAAGFIVYDDTACMVEVARQLSRFLWIESCGQCPPCKLGSGAITEHLTRLEGGIADTVDVDEIGSWLDKVTDGARCFLATEERNIVGSILRRFPDEVVAHIEGGRCPRPRPLPLPKLVDLRDGTATYDDNHWRKRPDWTYGTA
jgi:NADH-quinone oxidoreductase subunit F